MAEKSNIEWTDSTVNFWWGCTKVGPGCNVVGALQGALVGRKQHMRMWCETPMCSMEMME